MTFAEKWMKVEIVMLSEISLTHKEKSHINSHLQSLYLKIKRQGKGRESLWEEKANQWERRTREERWGVVNMTQVRGTHMWKHHDGTAYVVQ